MLLFGIPYNWSLLPEKRRLDRKYEAMTQAIKDELRLRQNQPNRKFGVNGLDLMIVHNRQVKAELQTTQFRLQHLLRSIEVLEKVASP